MNKQKIIQVTLDLTDCKYLCELHQRIKEALHFPGHYGANWDAFRDSLRADCPANHIRITGMHTVAEGLKDQLETMRQILEEQKLRCARYHNSGWTFDYEIIE